MKNNWKRQATTRLNQVVGKNYSFERLKEWIERSKDRAADLMLCLTALTPNKKNENLKKRRLRQQFLNRYLPEIRELYQVPYQDEPFQRWPIAHEKEFINEMILLKKKGYFPKCSYKKLSGLLCKHFGFNIDAKKIYEIIKHFLYNKRD